MRLTKAQKKALLWLPDNGAWVRADRSVSAALSMLCLYHKDLAKSRCGDYGPRGARIIQYALTEKGSQAAREIQKC